MRNLPTTCFILLHVQHLMGTRYLFILDTSTGKEYRVSTIFTLHEVVNYELILIRQFAERKFVAEIEYYAETVFNIL